MYQGVTVWGDKTETTAIKHTGIERVTVYSRKAASLLMLKNVVNAGLSNSASKDTILMQKKIFFSSP